MASETDTVERYKASMVLSGVGDALGYKNQEWEYNKSGPDIHKQLADLGGLSNITVQLPGWPVSDDTVMHLATAEALVIDSEKKEHIYLELCRRYVACMNDMEGRKPGPTSILGCQQMSPTNAAGGWHIPFNPTGTGCGAAMRAMCIGLRCPRPDQLDDLIAFSVESGRMTHHNPHGYCGALASALFVSYSVQGKPLREWGKGLLDTLPRALDYVKKSIRSAYENEEAWFYFPAKWEEYLEERGLLDGTSDPTWPENYDDPAVRDKIYKNDISSDGWPGRRGHDAPLIAYDALLAAGGNWEELCSRAMFHGGDSDSTGVIAAACFGVLYGYEGVPACNHEKLEYRSRLEKLGEQLYHKSHP
ncbi:ADP-ribosylhydrolase ARH1-like isoform X2 [Branchiostoma floridae x Branchiostoma belcheri]